MSDKMEGRLHHPFDDLKVDISHTDYKETNSPCENYPLVAQQPCSCESETCLVQSAGPTIFKNVESDQDGIVIEATTNLITSLAKGAHTNFQEEIRKCVRYKLYVGEHFSGAYRIVGLSLTKSQSLRAEFSLPTSLTTAASCLGA